MNRSRVSQRSLINLLHVTALLIAMLVVVVGCASETPAAVPIDEATDSAPPPRSLSEDSFLETKPATQ